MVLKLIKYDLRSMLKSFIPLWAAVLVLSIINGAFAHSPAALVSGFGEVIFGLSIFMYIILIIAINVIGIVLVIQRFYNGLLKDEGYLMFTLPAAPWQHVVSKGIAGLIVVTVNALISILSIFILAAFGNDYVEWSTLLREFSLVMTEAGLNGAAFIILSVLVMLISTMASIYQIYASMALGHLANKHRVGWSVAAYMGTSFAISIISAVCGLVAEKFGAINWFEGLFERAAETRNLSEVSFAFINSGIIISLIQLAAFYIITERILAKKLNLE